MTLGRYICAVVVLVAASLTPSGCSDVAEQAMAYENAGEPIEITIERSAQGVDYSVDRYTGDRTSNMFAYKIGS
ncbi:MAG: hypothetical protein WD021_04230 [Rhodothermales bacterium]